MSLIAFTRFKKLCVFILCLSLAPLAGAQQRLIFGHILEESTAHHRQLLWAAEQIQQRLGGYYQLEVFPKGQLGNTDAQVIEGFNKGTTHMAYLSLGHLVNLYGPLSIGAGPFVFRDFDHWQAFNHSDLYRELVQGFEKETGMKALGLAYYGQRHVTSHKPLRGLEDLRGLVIRVPNIPTMIRTFRLLGAKPVPIPFHETYQALQDGVVQAQENPLPAIKAMRFYEVTPVINLTAHITDAQLIVIREDVWNALPPDDQQILGDIFQETGRRVTADVRQEEIELLDWFRTAGVTINQPDTKSLAVAVRPALVGEDFPWGAAIYERLQAIH